MKCKNHIKIGETMEETNEEIWGNHFNLTDDRNLILVPNYFVITKVDYIVSRITVKIAGYVGNYIGHRHRDHFVINKKKYGHLYITGTRLNPAEPLNYVNLEWKWDENIDNISFKLPHTEESFIKMIDDIPSSFENLIKDKT